MEKTDTCENKINDKDRVLLIISGPTCAGKDTLIRELQKRTKNLRRLVTTNSRPKRVDEKEGVDYYFVSKDEFEKLIAEDAFFEWVEYRGHYRGGQKKHVKGALGSGQDVVWRIDVRGVKNIYQKVKEFHPRSAFVFLTAPLNSLSKRMKRGDEDKKWKDWNINRAKWELKQSGNYDYIVKNEDGKLEEAVKAVKSIIESVRRKNLNLTIEP